MEVMIHDPIIMERKKENPPKTEGFPKKSNL